MRLARLTYSHGVEDQLLALQRLVPPAVDCLLGAFGSLVSEELVPPDLQPDLLEPNLHGIDRCGFTILISVKGQAGHIVGLAPARNGLRGIL